MLKEQTHSVIAYFLLLTLGVLFVGLGFLVKAGYFWYGFGAFMLVCAAVRFVTRLSLPQSESEEQIGSVTAETVPTITYDWNRPLIARDLGKPTDDCSCLPGGPARFEEKYLGMDPTNGRYGDVHLRTCHGCGRRWLHYRAEYEAFTASGRWILGLLPDELPLPLTTENAVPILNSLPWYSYGGGMYQGVNRGTGDAPADLFPAPKENSD